MLSLGRLRRQSALLDRYCALLRLNRAAAPPEGLDPDLVVVAQAVERDNALPAAPATFRADLWSRIEAQGGAPRPWTQPVIDRNAGRRAQVRETEEQPAMTASTEQPLSLEQRRLSKELWKLAAAIAIFAIVGAVLVMLLRDDDNEPTVAAPSTPTTLASPAAESTATVAATSTVEPSVTVDTAANATAAARETTVAEWTATADLTATAYAALPIPGEIVAEIPVGFRPFGIAATDNAIWVAIADEGTVMRIDPATNAVVATVPFGPEGPDTHAGLSDLASYDGQVWTINNVDDTLVRIDPATNQVAQEIEVTPAAGSDDFDPFFMLVDESGIWTTERDAGRLLHIDPVSGAVLGSVDVTLPGWMASGFGSIWVNTYQDTSDSTLVRIDQTTHEIISEFPLASGGTLSAPGYVVTGAGSVWMSDFSSGNVVRIDPETNTVVATVDSGLGSGQDMAVTEAGVWIMASTSTGIVRIDVDTNQPGQALPYGNGWYLVEHDGSVWIAATQDDAVVRIDVAP